MMRPFVVRVRWLMCLVLFGWLAPVTVALADSDSPSDWLDRLTLWPGMVVVDRHQDVNVSYRLVLSELKRQSATTFGERERVVQGDVWRGVWEVGQRINLDQLVQQVRQQMPSDGDVLYACESLDCGSSHFWANEIFANGRLVGRDRYQRYLVLSQTLANQRQRVYLLYATYRGGRQTVMSMNVVETDVVLASPDVTPQNIEEQLANNSGWLPGFVTRDGVLDQKASAVLLDALKALPDGLRQRLFLTVHCYGSTDMDENLQCSERLSSQLRVATFNGVTELSVSGLGALVLPEHHNTLEPAVRFVVWPTRR